MVLFLWGSAYNCTAWYDPLPSCRKSSIRPKKDYSVDLKDDIQHITVTDILIVRQTDRGTKWFIIISIMCIECKRRRVLNCFKIHIYVYILFFGSGWSIGTFTQSFVISLFSLKTLSKDTLVENSFYQIWPTATFLVIMITFSIFI